jgi:hypothetical protein
VMSYVWDIAECNPWMYNEAGECNPVWHCKVVEVNEGCKRVEFE